MLTGVRAALAALAVAGLTAGHAAAAEVDAAKAFGARPMVRHASLSPDGESIALVQPLADGKAYGLLVARLGSPGFKPILTSTGDPDQLLNCGWVSNARLVCDVFFTREQDGLRIGFGRLVAINADGSDFKLLSARPTGDEYSYMQDGGDIIDWLARDADGAVLMTRDFAEQYSTGTFLANKREGLAVERVDTNSLKRSIVEQPRAGAIRYITDQHGVVRIYAQRPRAMDGYNKAEIQYFYRPGGEGAFEPLSVYDSLAETGFWPLAVDRDLNVAYGFDSVDGRRAVVRVALDGSLKREVVMARDDVDVDELIRIGRQKRVVGVGYATDRRHAVFFDPALKSLAASLSKALPGQPQVRFVDANLDETRLLVWAGSDVNPGRYYLYDKPTKRLIPVVEERPQLTAVKLSTVRTVSYRASDGTQVPAYLTLPPSGQDKNLPAIVLPHGGPSARDEWGFDWLAQFFANRGYAVLQPNFRGSAGYGDAWFQENGFRSWRTAVGDVNDAGRWLKDEGIAAPGKLAIVGWSYGGYAALQSHILDADLYKATIAIAPVTDLDALREESRDFMRFRVVDAFIGTGAHVEEGSPARNADKIKAPVLLFHGDKDDNVGVAQSRLMLTRLQRAGAKAELVEFPGLDHQLDDSQARERMLAKSEAFLRQALGL